MTHALTTYPWLAPLVVALWAGGALAAKIIDDRVARRRRIARRLGW